MVQILYGTDEPTVSSSREDGIVVAESNPEEKSKISTKMSSGIRMSMADRSAVEGQDNEYKTNKFQVYKTQDIIKIFVDSSSNDYIEVTKEQLERVKAMHERMEDGASFSFNYNILLLTASILAGLGLISNSGTTVIASMLVSPIMGPVVGMAYGSSIQDWRLVRKSIVTETISLMVCILIGLIIAGCTGPLPLADDWPTQEMFTRGTWENFFVGLPIAFFSGLGVAVSLLDDQTSSLVGVAISASLLPPAVNSGILFLAYSFDTNCTRDDIDCSDTNFLHDSLSDHVRLALISLLLTVANIILVCGSSMLMFRMKEVLPVQKKKVFWQDLGVARKIYQKRAFIVDGEPNDVADVNVSVFQQEKNAENTPEEPDQETKDSKV